MKAITIKQPWASLIVEGIKDIENRTWKTNFRGRVLIHAGQIPVKFDGLADILTKEQYNSLNGNIEPFIGNHCGYIVGSVEIVDCVINHPSVWAEKTECDYFDKRYYRGKDNPVEVSTVIGEGKIIYNWTLANPIKFDNPIPCKGKLSFWDYNGEFR